MKLYYQDVSSGFEEEEYQAPIIFLHAMGFSGKNFKNVAPIISKNTKRKAYLLDARNHGKSPWSYEMSYDDLTNDLLEFMESHDLQKAVLIGSSMGGRTAINFALKHPDKVEALIVEDMTPRNVVSSNMSLVQQLLAYVNHTLESIPPGTSLKEAKRMLFDDFVGLLVPLHADAEKVGNVVDMDVVHIVKDGSVYKLECNVPAIVAMLENNALVQDLPDQNLVFNGDALFLYGSKGFFNLDMDPSVKKLFPRAIIKRVERSSHLIHVDSPELYSSVISDFLLHRNAPDSKY